MIIFGGKDKDNVFLNDVWVVCIAHCPDVEFVYEEKDEDGCVRTHSCKSAGAHAHTHSTLSLSPKQVTRLDDSLSLCPSVPLSLCLSVSLPLSFFFSLSL